MKTIVEIGPLVQRYRESTGLTRRALSESCGFSVAYVGMIERGERRPTMESAAGLLSKLGFQIDRSSDPWVLAAPDLEAFMLPVWRSKNGPESRVVQDRDAVQVRIAEALERIANALDRRH